MRLFAGMLLLAGGLTVAGQPSAWANATNVMTLHDDDNATGGVELLLPKDDPTRDFRAKREVERGRLEAAIIKVQRNLRAVQDSNHRLRLLDIQAELERRLRMLNTNPNRYFTVYPYELPEE